jgi:hypothetical protein
MTAEEKKERRIAEKEARRVERRQVRAAKAEQEAEEEKLKEQQRQEAIAAKAAKKEQRKQTQAALKAMEEGESSHLEENSAAQIDLPASEEKPRADQFAAGADEIKLGVNVDGKARTVPGVGLVDRYPTKAEKREKKLKAEAFENGMTVDEWKAKLEKEREELDRPKLEELEKLRQSRGGLKGAQWRKYCILAEREGQEVAEKFFVEAVKANRELELKAEAEASGSASAEHSQTNGHATAESTPSQVKPLSEKKRAKYAKKATKKGMTVEEYAAYREAKKTQGSEPDALSEEERTAEPNVTTTNGVSTQGSTSKFYAALAEVKALKSQTTSGTIIKEATFDQTELGFVVDAVGDPESGPAFVIDGTGDPDVLTRPKAPLLWHPDMLGDREVKQLSKEERKARLEWMREKRRERNIAMGKNPMSRKERHKRRVEKKMKQRDRYVWEIMQDKGKPKELVTKEELNDARRKAKRKLREEKREKRNKVIHRKKLGEGLRGVYGGQISQG